MSKAYASSVDIELISSVAVKALCTADEIIFITDSDGVILYVNATFEKIYGYKKEEALGAQPSIVSSKKHTQAFYKRLWDTLLARKNYHELLINQNSHGNLVYVDTKITPVELHDTLYFFTLGREVTKRIVKTKKLEKLATIDELTSIPNRFELNRSLDTFIGRAKRKGNTFALLMFDIDHFKAVNDKYGHSVGDTVLKNFAQTVKEHVRDFDLFGRWGGEEFLLLLDDTNEHTAMQIANKLNKIVARSKFDNFYCITVSIGVTEYRDGDTKSSMLERADRALYAAKDLGRDRVIFN